MAEHAMLLKQSNHHKPADKRRWPSLPGQQKKKWHARHLVLEPQAGCAGQEAALEKLQAGEGRNVEHVAQDIDDAATSQQVRCFL